MVRLTNSAVAALSLFPTSWGAATTLGEETSLNITSASTGTPSLSRDWKEVPGDPRWMTYRSTCWRDVVDGLRSMTDAARNFDIYATTPARCRSACEAQGFRMAGVEFGHECWCSNTLLGHPYPIGEEYCNFPCSGGDRKHLMCGGLGYMNLFWLRDAPWKTQHQHHHQQPASQPGDNKDNTKWEFWDPVGCFKDLDSNHRLLPFAPSPLSDVVDNKNNKTDTIEEAALLLLSEPPNRRTAEGCAAQCAHHGMAVAGLEYGRECWCGETVPSGRFRGGRCDMPCVGDGEENCGGKHALMVYHRREKQSHQRGGLPSEPVGEEEPHDEDVDKEKRPLSPGELVPPPLPPQAPRL